MKANMLKTTAIFLVISATSAFAAFPPGPPPWSCHPFEACNDDGACVSLMSLPAGFRLDRVEGDRTKYTYRRADGSQQLVIELPSLDEAKHFVETDKTFTQMPRIIVPNDLMFDTHGFWLLSSFTRLSGGRFLSEEKISIACNSVRR